MKKIVFVMLLFSLLGCTKKNDNNTHKEKRTVDATKTIAFEKYYLNDRERINENDLVFYGVSETGYLKRYNLYANSSIVINEMSNYRDNDKGERICDTRSIYILEDHKDIYVKVNDVLYQTLLTDQILDELNILTRKQIDDYLDTASNFEVSFNEYNVEYDEFKVDYKGQTYTMIDYSYVNTEYVDTYAYSIPMAEGKEGFLSIEKANNYNILDQASIDTTNATMISEEEFINKCK